MDLPTLETGSPDRITESYVPGHGDTGYSHILHGHPPFRKDHPACEVQGSIEQLRHEIETCLSMTPVQQEALRYVLEWLNRNLFSLASFCYFKGKTDKFQLPIEFLDYLNKETAKLKKALGNCPDFLSQGHPLLVNLDGIRIQSRALERAYIAWWNSHEVSNFLMRNPELIAGVQLQAAIINRLSAYLFEAIRMEGQLLTEQGVALTSSVWQAEVEPFNPIA